MSSIESYLEAQQDGFVEELCDLLRIPSVSAQPAHQGDMRRAADWIEQRFRRMGFSTEVIPTSGHPLVYAESPRVENAPTVLVYGHYDVQPAEPFDLWTSPPFEPTRRDGHLFARGATDDKGQMLTHVFSAQAWIEVEGRLPLNLKYLIEGEEEVGSASLAAFVRENRERLACDCVVISDGAQFGPEQPAITYGLRGIAYYDLVLTGPNRDLHSGSFGGTVTNPANALARILAALIDEHGRIQVPGFYDDVVPLSERERQQMAALPFDERQYLEQIGVSGLSGEEGYTTLERRWARPTYDINGLSSGYQGDGAKTVLPKSAAAKFSFRLVPNQDPEKIGRALRTMLAALCPPGIQLELDEHHNTPGVLIPMDSASIAAAARAIERAFGRAPVYTREGGSIPVVSTFHEALGVDILLLGWGQDDDNTHSPNEKFSLVDFHRGIKASALLWEELSKPSR
ncbi:MAG: dipeptidase [Pirellulales bacterium]|nr:dipeptidase [Pirellulales bacterium]